MIQSQFVYYINMEKYGFICPTIYKCVRQDFLFLMFCYVSYIHQGYIYLIRHTVKTIL